MQKTFKLRKFTIDDLRSVIHINRICLPENYNDYFFIDLYRRFPETFIVSEENGVVIGYIMCRIESGLIALRGLVKKGHVVSFAVLPKFRRKGIGQALVTQAIKGMQLYNAKQCFLEVRITNKPAINLYKKLGFQIAKMNRSYYADGEDAFVMTKLL